MRKKRVTIFQSPLLVLLKSILIRLPRAHVWIAPCATILFQLCIIRGATFSPCNARGKVKETRRTNISAHTRTHARMKRYTPKQCKGHSSRKLFNLLASALGVFTLFSSFATTLMCVKNAEHVFDVWFEVVGIISAVQRALSKKWILKIFGTRFGFYFIFTLLRKMELEQ